MLVIKQFGPITYVMGILREILAATNIVAGSRALPNDVAGCTLEMGADGLWTGASVGTMSKATADALYASGALANLATGTTYRDTSGTQYTYGGMGVGWVEVAGGFLNPYPTFSDLQAITAPLPGAEAWALPGPTKFIRAKNLFVASTTTPGFIDEAAGGITPSADYFTSDFIAVKPTVYSFATQARFVAYFDSSKTIIIKTVNSEMNQRIDVPTNCAYIRVTFRETNRLSVGIYEGDSLSPWLAKPSSASAVSVGGCTDSLGGTGWSSLVSAALGLQMNLNVAGGTKISGSADDSTAMCNDTRALAVNLTSRFLLLMGGTNDWAQSIPLGTQSSVDQTTFFGALNVLLSKWTNKYVNSRILLITTNYGNMPTRVTSSTWTDPEINIQGLRTTDYADAIRNRAAYWGCSIIDCSRDAGINNGNKAQYLTNDGNYLHHNAKGIIRIAKLVTDAIDSMLIKP